MMQKLERRKAELIRKVVAKVRSRVAAANGEGLAAPTAAVFFRSGAGHLSSPNKKPGQEPGLSSDLLSRLFNVAASRSDKSPRKTNT